MAYSAVSARRLSFVYSSFILRYSFVHCRGGLGGGVVVVGGVVDDGLGVGRGVRYYCYL